MWIASSERSREMDRRATEEYGVPPLVLMERAGLAVFDAIRELAPSGCKLTIVCGRGNNGGDGMVVARHAQENGYAVEVLIAAAEAELREDAHTQVAIARAQGIEPIFHNDPRYARRLECLGSRNLIVDALLGTGATGEVRGPVQEAIRAINMSGVPVVSVDLPSGIHPDTGEELAVSIWALRTVTFGLPKPYLFQGMGLEHSGYWTVADVGYPSALLNEPTEAKLVDPDWVASILPERLRSSHKGENGHVLIVGGSRRMPGAATLAAKSAMRAGAGLVTVAAIPSVCEAVAANIPEALLLPLPEVDGVMSPQAAELLSERQGIYNAALFGPGLTHEQPVLEMLSKTWAEWQRPTIVDADALNSVSQGVELPSAPCVLTPHPGEMSRLLRTTIAEIQADRFRSVHSALAKFGNTVLLKGPYSIVGHSGSPLLVNSTGNPGMASGGMGDVLSGVIVTLLAQAIPPVEAAACGMYWHGLAGDMVAADRGPIGYLASDVVDALPLSRAKLTGSCCRDSAES